MAKSQIEEPEIPTTEEQEIPQTININGEEFSLEDAQNFISKGRQTAELEKQYNTSFDKVWPEYGRLSQQAQEWTKEKEGYERTISEFQSKQDRGVETPQDVREAQEAARKLGIVLNDDLSQAGYVKRDEIDTYIQQKLAEDREVQKILSEADELSTKIDGSDGRPMFNKRAVLAYANQYGIRDLNQAYEDMNKESLDRWRDAQVTAQKNKGIKTFGQGGEKQPKATKLTDDNVGDALREVLGGTDE